MQSISWETLDWKKHKQDDYRMLDEFYKQKIQQVHIVGEYANLMVRVWRIHFDIWQN